MSALNEALEPFRHDPTFLYAKRQSWARCTCGWESGYGTQFWTQLEFGKHLIKEASDG